jgi:pilus assembly protein CpaE
LDLGPRAEELDEEIFEEVMRLHSASGVKILSAPSRPEYAEQVSGDQFTKIITFMRNLFSYTVIDASSNLTDISLAALDLSDLIILITTQDIPSIKNARLFLDLTGSLGINKRRVLFVMNRFDKRIGITPEKVGESFKHDIVAVIPAEERIVVPSINRGVPFMMGDRTRPIAKSVLALVEVIRQRLAEMAAEEAEKVAVSRR